jgi:hypothetical protein
MAIEKHTLLDLVLQHTHFQREKEVLLREHCKILLYFKGFDYHTEMSSKLPSTILKQMKAKLL